MENKMCSSAAGGVFAPESITGGVQADKRHCQPEKQSRDAKYLCYFLKFCLNAKICAKSQLCVHLSSAWT